MNLTDEYIGQEVRRIVFSMKRATGEFIHIFSILEKIDEDMQDFQDFAPNYGKEYNDYIKDADGSTDKIFLTVDRITVTKDLFEEPWENYLSGKVQLLSASDKYRWPNGDKEWRILPSDSNERTELSAMLPRRSAPRYVRYCVPAEISDVIAKVLRDEKLRTQLSELSKRNLGYDLAEHKNYLGGFVFLTYNDIYRKIGFSEKEAKDGIYCRIDYKSGKGRPLTIRCIRHGNDEGTLGMDEFELNGCSSLYELGMMGSYRYLELQVLDKERSLLDYYNRLVFIHSIHVDAHVGATEVHVTDNKGKVVKTIQKFDSAEKFVVGEKNISNGMIDTSPEFAYRLFEDALDFVFYDGDRDHAEDNISKAQADLLKILNRAREQVYICDVFFDLKALTNFVLPMSSRTVPVRILSSKKELKKDGKRVKLTNAIMEINKKGIGNIKCRLMTGKKAELHDRFVVADEQVWMLGCSLNEFGNRATTLIRVPKDYRQKLIERAEEWWRDDNLSVDINDVKDNDNTKQRCFICKWLDKLCTR